VAKGHLGAVEVEEVHELGRLALAKSVVVDPFRLIVELDLDGEDLDALCERYGSALHATRHRNQRTEEGFYDGRVGLNSGSSSSSGGKLEGAERFEEVEGVLVDVEAQRIDLDLWGGDQRGSQSLWNPAPTFMTISS
jgi:hypothetical protein